MEYYSAIKKNTFESVLMRWVKLEPTVQSEVSQREKYQYSILTHCGPPGAITWTPRGNHVGPQGQSRGPPGAIRWAPRGNHVGP